MGLALNGWTDNQRVTMRIDTLRALRSHHNHVELVKSVAVAAAAGTRRHSPGGSGWSSWIDEAEDTS